MTEDSPSTPPHAAEQQSDPWRKHRIWAGVLTVFLGLVSAIFWLVFAPHMTVDSPALWAGVFTVFLGLVSAIFWLVFAQHRTEDSPSTPSHAAEQQADPWRKHRILAGVLTIFLGLISAIFWLAFGQQMSFVSGVMSGYGPSGISIPLPVVAIVLGIIIGGLMFCGKQGRGRPMVWLAAVTVPLLTFSVSKPAFKLIVLAIGAYLIWVLRNTKPAEESLRVAVSRMATPKNLGLMLVGFAIVLLMIFGDEISFQYNKKYWKPSERLHGLTIDMSYEDVLRSKGNPASCRPGVPDFYSGIRQDGEFVCGWILESRRDSRKRYYPNKTLQVTFAQCHATKISADNLGGINALSHPRDENSLGLPFNSVSQMHEVLGKEDMLTMLGTRTKYSYIDWGVSYVFVEDLLLRVEIGDIEREHESNQEDLSEYATVKSKAESGDAEAQASIGYFYMGRYSGIQSPADLVRQVEQRPDYAEAYKWLRLAAEQGHFSSQLSLARRYTGRMRYELVGGEIILLNSASTVSRRHNAEEVSPQTLQDLAEAAKWLGLSAEQGDKHSQHQLGAMYASGTGVPQDNILAYMWLYLAHEQGYTDRVSHRAIADHMTSDDISTAQAKAHEWLKAHMAAGCRTVSTAIN